MKQYIVTITYSHGAGRDITCSIIVNAMTAKEAGVKAKARLNGTHAINLMISSTVAFEIPVKYESYVENNLENKNTKHNSIDEKSLLLRFLKFAKNIDPKYLNENHVNEFLNYSNSCNSECQDNGMGFCEVCGKQITMWR